MKKLVKCMSALLIVASIVVFMGCKQPTDGDAGQNATPDTDITKPEEKPNQDTDITKPEEKPNQDTDITKPEDKPLPPGLKILPSGTNGTFGTEGKYVEFGIWPQTRLADESIITDKNNTVKVNNWDCYKGSDGSYYVRFSSYPYYDGGEKPKSKFDDGTIIDTDTDYYFRLEPIVWRIVTTDYFVPDGKGKYKSSGRKLLLSEKALYSTYFDIYSGYYVPSFIREELNIFFLNRAFTPNQIAAIPVTEVDNSYLSEKDDGEPWNSPSIVTDYVLDKIFLLSKKEATTKAYGFKGSEMDDPAKQRKPTDLAKARGVTPNKDNACAWWLRSNSGKPETVCTVEKTGHSRYTYYAKNSLLGYVPALTISF